MLEEWAAASLNVATAAKRGIYTIHQSLVIKRLGHLSAQDAERLASALRSWLAL